MNMDIGNPGIAKAQMTVMDRVPTEIEGQLQELKGLNEGLFRICEELKKRLGSVLKPREQKEPPPTPRPALVPLAEALREIGDNMRNAIGMLDEIHEGVEL